MFRNLFTSKSKDKSVLDFISEVLFPPIIRLVEDGTEFFIDRSIDANLMAVLNDLQDGYNDKHTLETLGFCIDQLTKVRVKYKIHSDIKSNQTTSMYMVSTNTDV